ncbi:Peptidase family C25 [Rosistilla ulvae]|uniref:Peptidase family C25 n=1 Tax=Rosistilla ulvae TaxID=1930277 RepID=A0A517M4I9_9BACT|nr:C25 family cysteine peptidase [Rosistilla ulvae]QDS89787.1 Peptidase family C25 [Rosistilla ulvae]
MLSRTLATLLALTLVSTAAARDAIVVCATDLRPAIGPWVEYRQSQGVTVHVVDSKPMVGDVVADLQAMVAARGLRPEAVVIFGDCRIQGPRWPVDPRRHVPTHHLASPVAASLGSLPTLATDSLYGDLDGDGALDVPVGRIPIARGDQVESFVDRVRRYEASRHFGPWRHQVDLTAGVGGFGLLIDAAMESVVRGILTSNLPSSIQTRVTYASPTSPFFPGAKNFCQTVVNGFNGGGLFWVYAGHGHVTQLDRVPATAAGTPILDDTSVSQLKRPAERSPIALLLACYTGAFDAQDDCLAEQMLLEPGGPIAVFAGSRMTLPYGNAIIATSLIQSWFESRPDTLGQVWLETSRLAVREPGQGAVPGMLDAMAAMLSPTSDRLPQERLEHTRLYNLLGDPLLQISHPEVVSLECPVSAPAGTEITVNGTAPHGGKLTLELHRRGEPSRDELRHLSEIDRHRAASDSLLERTICEVEPGEFAVQLKLPATLTKSSLVLARIESEDRYSLGTDRILIDRESRETPVVQAASPR